MIEKTLYCKKCVMPTSSAAMSMNEELVCSACEYHEAYQNISNQEWDKRKIKFEKILNDHKKDNYYDCIIPVSGGKDSYYQAHLISKNLILNHY